MLFTTPFPEGHWAALSTAMHASAHKHTVSCQGCFLSHTHSHNRLTGLSALLVMSSDSVCLGVSGRQGGIEDGMIAFIMDVGLYL